MTNSFCSTWECS